MLEPSTPEKESAGVWVSRRPPAPAAIRVSLTRIGSQWRVTAGRSASAPAAVQAGRFLDFRFEEGVVRLAAKPSRAPEAYWIQPRQEPLVSYPFATPLRFRSIGRSWTALVQPLQPPGDLRLTIERSAAGAQFAYIRESGRNYAGGRRFRVAPGEPMIIQDRLVSEGGWIRRSECSCFNFYRPPMIAHGDENAAKPWIEHIQKVYPNEWTHIVRWLAHRAQRPGEKINHALVLGGNQGIGNWSRTAVGFTEGRVARDGGYVEIPLMLADAAAIDAYDSGRARELSAGYKCELVWGDGIAPDGTSYQAKQVSIRGNHIALVPAGRAGSECRIGDSMHSRRRHGLPSMSAGAVNSASRVFTANQAVCHISTTMISMVSTCAGIIQVPSDIQQNVESGFRPSISTFDG